MNPPRETSDNWPGIRVRLGLLCIAVGIATAFPAAALASPSNDNFANAYDLGGAPTASPSGTNVAATAEPGEPSHAGEPATASVWYRWTAPASGLVRIDTCGSNFDTVLAVYTGSALNALTEVASNEDSDFCPLQSLVRFNATAGTTYRIAVDGFGGDQGSFQLRLARSPPNDDFANAQGLGGGPTASASGTNLAATAEPGEPSHVLSATASVWYRWTAPASGSARIDTCGSNFDTVLAVYTGSFLRALTQVASNDDFCGLQSQVSFAATAGTTYRIAVDSFLGDEEGSIELGVATVPPPPPPPPLNEFSFGKVKKNKKKGTAKLTVNVPGQGELNLAKTKKVKADDEPAEAAGTENLLVKPKGKARKKLNAKGKAKGKAKVNAEVTYTPTGGTPNTESKTIKLVKR